VAEAQPGRDGHPRKTSLENIHDFRKAQRLLGHGTMDRRRESQYRHNSQANPCYRVGSKDQYTQMIQAVKAAAARRDKLCLSLCKSK
jgi:hydroxyacyl-ACP dehydratase HTD2-like protein with hotdog domain